MLPLCQVNPIVCRCHDAIETSMRGVSPDEDALVVVERFKSGDVPPGDFKFEDMRDPQAMLAQVKNIDRKTFEKDCFLVAKF